MNLSDLRPGIGARPSKRRVGRGHGSGRGKTAGRGTKGQKARTGGQINPRFEGGQLSIVHRLPQKRGFKNRFRVETFTVNLDQLGRFQPGTVVTPSELEAAGLVPARATRVKILGDGAIAQALTVQAHAFSSSARAKIEGAGGQAVVIGEKVEAVDSAKE